ncbi:AAA+ ATPase [Pelomyxa schiedti]|nr:AAA+ ATPase [Pelomyxa schiedti]
MVLELILLLKHQHLGVVSNMWKVYLEDFVSSVLKQLCSNTQLPVGIAKTNAFLENLFCTVVCMDAMIPLVIVGPPGCSKTLSFKIAIDNMKGDTSMSPFYQKLHHILPFRYQCSERSTDMEIKDVYNSAIERQKTFPENSNQICTVLLDEVGLPDENQSPLKSLHYKLDHPKVSSILLSNRILDEAKTNRTLMLLQSEPPPDDLVTLAQGCIFDNDTEISGLCKEFLRALCVAYQDATLMKFGSKYPSRFFHLRDFVYFLRFLRKHSVMQRATGSPIFQMSREVVLHGLKRNFGGLEKAQFSKLVEMFFDRINVALARFRELLWNASTLDERGAVVQSTDIPMIRESLAERLLDSDDPNTAPFRYIMLLDPTENEAAVSLLFDLKLCDRATTSVCYVGDFADDRDQRVKAAIIEKVKTAMERGETVLLVNSTSIHSSFYDVFNRHYTVIPRSQADISKDPTKNPSTRCCYANIAAGSFSQPCLVHNDFRLIVHVPKSMLRSIPAPLLNRFEKYTLGVDDALQDHFSRFRLDPLQVEGAQMHPFEVLKNAAMHMVQELHVKSSNSLLFYGLHAQETVSSLILTVAEYTQTKAVEARRSKTKTVEVRPDGNPQGEANIGHHEEGPSQQSQPQDEEAQNTFNCNAVIPQFPPVLSASTLSENSNSTSASSNAANTTTSTVATAGTEPHSEATKTAGTDNVFAEPSHWETNIREYIRKINFHLLKLGRPESMYLCKRIPKIYLREYLLSQEHFSIYRFLEQLCKASASNSDDPTKTAVMSQYASKWCVFTRTSAELLKLPHDEQFHSVICNSIGVASGKGGGRTAKECLQVFSLSEISCSQQCSDLVSAFCSSETHQLLICLADLTVVTSHQINFVRNEINECWKRLTRPRIALVLLHYSPETGIRSESSYHAIFRNGWDFMYIDSLGIAPGNAKIKAHPEANPSLWISQAYNIHTHGGGKPQKLDESNEAVAFREPFFDLLQQFCAFMGGSLLGAAGLKDESLTFYSRPTFAKGPVIAGSIRFKILQAALTQHPLLYEGLLEQLSRSWTPEFLRKLVHDASVELYRGSCVQSFVSIFSNSFNHFLIPLIQTWLKMMLSSYGLQPVLSIFTSHEESVSSKLMELVHLVYKTIAVPQLDNKLLSKQLVPTVTISRVFETPSELPFFDPISNVLQVYVSKAASLLRNSKLTFDVLEEKVIEIIKENRALNNVVEHINSNQQLFSMFKQDFLLRTMKQTNLSFPKFSEATQNKDPEAWCNFVHILIDMMCHLSGGTRCRVTSLFVAKRFHADDINYFRMLLYPLQNLKPSLEGPELQLLRNIPRNMHSSSADLHEAHMKMGSWVTEQITIILWDRLMALLQPSKFSRDMFINWGQAYRRFYTHLKPRNELAILLSNSYPTLLKIDAMRVLFLFVLNIDPQQFESSLRFLQYNPNIASVMEQHSKSQYLPGNRLIQGLLLAINFLPPLADQATPLEEHSFRAVTEYYLMDPTQTVGISTDSEENLKAFLMICRGTFQHSNAALVEYCKKMSTNFGWWMNVLNSWILSKPYQWIVDSYQIISALIAEYKTVNKPFKYSFRPDLLCPTPGESATSLEYALFHILLAAMCGRKEEKEDPHLEGNTETRNNGTAGQSNNQDARLKDPHHKDTVSEKDPNHETGRQKQFSFPFYQLQDALAFYQSIPLNFENGAEAVFAVMQKAASGSTLLRLAAAGLGGENGIQDQVKAIASVVKEIFDSPSAPIRCKEYFLNHIHSEETLLTLLKCLPALQQLNLTDFHTSGSVELEKVYHFPFMLPRNSPEYRGQRATLLSNPDFNSTTFLDLERIFGLVTSGAQAGTAELIRVLKNELSIPETQQIRIYEIKMCLVLVAYYQYFVNKTPCNAILSALSELKGTLSLSDKEILALDFLSTGPKDIPDMENSILYSFSRQSYESKVDQTLEHTVANLMVNILAITIALPVTNHMHMRMFKIEACDGTLCPGSGYHRKNKDCGFQMYKGKLHDLAADPPIMRNSAPHRFALNTITWCSFCWALILDPQGHMKAKNYRDTFLNCLEDVKNTNLAHKIHGYIHNRALGFFLELENDGEFRQQHIDASHFITEALLLIWQHMHANPNDPCLPQGGIYRDADKPKVVEYENMIQKVFDVIQAKYDLLKSAFLKAREDTSPFKTIVTLRSEQAKMLPSLIVSWDLFSELVAKTSASELLRTFIDVRPKLRAVSKIPELVHYYKFLNEAFSPFLLEDDVNLPMPDCIQKVMTTNAELANTMKAEFQKFLSAWDVIHDAIGEIEGCPLQMAERRFEASVPVVDVTTPFSEFVSFQDTGRGDMIYRMIHTLCHEIQNKLLAGYNKTWTAPGINPCEFVCDNTVASNNVEFIPYQTETALLVTGESSPRELEFALSNCMQISNDGSRANVTVDDIQLHRHITSRYLTGRCFLIDDNLRQVFVFLHPEEQQQQQQPATNEEAQDQKSSKSDQQELQLDQAVARLPAANFSDQIPSYQRPKLEVALNAQTEEQIRELMQNCTLLLQGLHREIRNNPTEPHHEQNFSLCWQKFLPSKAIPEPFHTLKSQRVSVIGTLSSIVLDKFKTKQWLFSGIGTRFESAPAASLQQELDSKIKKITTEASFGEVKKLYAVVSAICRVFTREHVTVHPPLTPLRNLFGEAESLPEGITKLEVDDFLSDFKVQHYCFFMRKVHTLCGDLLVELSAREVEGDCYQEPVPNIKLAKGQSEFEEGTPPHTGEENSGIVICPLVTAPEGDVVLTQATSIPHSDIESTKQEADKIVKHVKEIADISKLTSLVGRINDHLTSVHQQEIPEGGESIRIRRMVAESVGRITSNLKDLSCDTTVITGKLNQIVTVSDEINQKIQSAQETEAAAALNELKNVEQTATEWLLKLDEMCAKMEVLEREASDLKLNPLPQPTETVTAASPPNLNELPPPLLPEKPPANRPATPPKQPGVFQPPSLHPPLASVTSTPGPQPYQPPPPQHYQPQPPPQPNMSRHPLPPLPQATPTTTLPSQGSPLPPPGMPTRPPPNPQLYSSQPSSPPPANLPPPPHNIPPVSYSIGPQQFMNSPPLYHHPSPTPAFVPSVPPTQYRYTNPPIMNHPQPQPQPPQQQPQPPYAQHPPITSLPPNMPLPPLYHTPNNFIPQTGPLPPLNPTGRVMPLPPANYNNQPMPMMPIPFPGQPHPPVSQPNIVSLPTHNTPVMPPPPPFNRRP